MNQGKVWYVIELWYKNKQRRMKEPLFIGGIVDFQWFHDTSDLATVVILNPDSEIFNRLGIDGKKVYLEVQRTIRKFIPERKLPIYPGNKPLSRNLIILVNG